jgi:DNA-binding Lrp family transcriptional regulator
VYAVYDVTGDFDSMIVAKASNRKDLDDLSKNVLSIEGVERTVTHLVLNTVKELPNSLPDYLN